MRAAGEIQTVLICASQIHLFSQFGSHLALRVQLGKADKPVVVFSGHVVFCFVCVLLLVSLCLA